LSLPNPPGYPYWKAFTTGKVAALGGIPHDTYGMTTSSIHTFVLGCLDMLGLKEEEVTKVWEEEGEGGRGRRSIHTFMLGFLECWG
jgi:glutamate dehydrogenase